MQRFQSSTNRMSGRQKQFSIGQIYFLTKLVTIKTFTQHEKRHNPLVQEHFHFAWELLSPSWCCALFCITFLILRMFCGSCMGGMCRSWCGVYVKYCCDCYKICRRKTWIMDYVGLTSDSLTTFASETLINCLLYTFDITKWKICEKSDCFIFILWYFVSFNG